MADVVALMFKPGTVVLQAPKSAGEFIEKIRIAMRHWLEKLNAGMPTNPKVHLREKGKRRIAVTPLDKQPEPPNTAALKREIGRRCRYLHEEALRREIHNGLQVVENWN